MSSTEFNRRILFSLIFVSFNSHAYEEESAVPLTIITQSNYANIENTAITINGRNIVIKSELINSEKKLKNIGFAAYTPFFSQLGEAEENEDKTFSDIEVLFNGKVEKLTSYRRGLFLGEDVTGKLVKAKIDPLPNKGTDNKGLRHRGLPLDNWQGYVAYSWITPLAPQSKGPAEIRYTAIPQFGLDDISSQRFSGNVAKHCGNVDEIKTFLKNVNHSFRYIYFERHEIPINFLNSRDVQIQVNQHAKKAVEQEPLFALTCGVTNRSGSSANFSGTLRTQENVISLFVIFKFPGSIFEE